jgi:hypothetical protein
LFEQQDANAMVMPMPNIDKIGAGYDIFFANPHAIGTIDPGFRSPVYNLTIYNGNRLTPDKRYLVSEGVDVTRSHACKTSFTTTDIYGTASYAKTLRVGVSSEHFTCFVFYLLPYLKLLIVDF